MTLREMGDDHRFIFVGGIHRSGTSALYKLIGSDPAVSIFRNTGVIEDEGQFLQDVIKPDGEFGGPGHFALKDEAHLTERSKQVANAKEHLFEQWSNYWDRDKPILAEKSPANMIRSRFLQAVFPNASFVFIMRHPIAACMATVKWTGAYMTTLIEHWINAHMILHDDLEHLERAVVLRYEDFTQQPQEYADALNTILGKRADVDWDIIKAGFNQKYYDRWKEGDFHLKEDFSWPKHELKRWRNKWEVVSIKRKYEESIQQFGYSFEGL